MAATGQDVPAREWRSVMEMGFVAGRAVAGVVTGVVTGVVAGLMTDLAGLMTDLAGLMTDLAGGGSMTGLVEKKEREESPRRTERREMGRMSDLRRCVKEDK